jgi:hypothetical protein
MIQIFSQPTVKRSKRKKSKSVRRKSTASSIVVLQNFSGRSIA